MRILQLTPGTGGFYCGSCIRDNALVSELRAQGQDVVMVPLYLPFLVDESDSTTHDQLFFGGINVYLQQKLPLFRHTPGWLDSILDSRTLLMLSARQAGMTRASELGELSLSMLNGEQGYQKKELGKLLHWIRTQEPFDIVCLSNCLLMGIAGPIRRELQIPVVCTLQGEDGFIDALPNPYRDSVWARLRHLVGEIDAFIPVSRYYADVMKHRMEIPEEKIHPIPNGISLVGYDSEPTGASGRVIGYLARLCEDKGLSHLVSVFIQLKKQSDYDDVILRIAGTMTSSDKPFVDSIRQRLENEGLIDHVEIRPNISRKEKIHFLQSLSVFSVPALYGESFGLYVLEALAAGVPVVQPRHAGFVEIVEQTGGGVLFRHDDPDEYLQALQRLLQDSMTARALGRKGKEEIHRFFHIGRVAQDTVRVYQSLLKTDFQRKRSEAKHGIGV